MKQIDTQSLNDLWGGQFFYNIPHFCLPSRKGALRTFVRKPAILQLMGGDQKRLTGAWKTMSCNS